MRLVPVLLLVACAQDPGPDGPVGAADPVDPAEETGALPSEIEAFQLPGPAWGVTRADRSLWFLAPGVGLLETTLDGRERSRIEWSENGLVDHGFTDLARLEGGGFALTANQEVWLYRPDVGALESWFCFIPEGDPIVQENQAIAYDARTGLVHVSPARWDTSTGTSQLLSVRLETYRAADASFYSTLDVTASGVIAHGLAWDAEASCTWSVSGSSLHRFSPAGVLEGTMPLPGIDDAQGILVDGSNLIILDGASGALHVIPRPSYL